MTDEPDSILVIEDNRELLDSLLEILSFLGYCAQGIAAYHEVDVEQLKTQDIDLILIDVMLAEADGRDLTRRFKATKGIRHIPIVMMSANPDVEPSAIASGADAFLPKPFGINELLDYIEQYIKRNT